jgi:ATP-dependent Zn protease
MEHDPLSGVMMDRDKRAMACQLIGQAYVAAHLLIEHNRAAVEKIADVLVERKELHGDEIVGLLDDSKLTLPEVDLTDEAIWPKL